MIQKAKQPNQTDETKPKRDNRFEKLIPGHQWALLPDAVKRRFTKQIKDCETCIYRGEITAMRRSYTGWCLANLLRLIAAPLPLHADIGTPTMVSVTEDFLHHGQVWTRIYAHRSGFPQVVHSAKRFEGPTGLLEYIGCGIAMLLKVHASEDGLTFQSAGYQFNCIGTIINLPRWLTPIDLVVKHINDSDNGFTFSLSLTAPFLGELIYQEGLYQEDDDNACN